MKTKYLLGAMAALMMTACSEDDVLSVQKNEIGYDVAVSTLTRAADSYCNKTLPADFNVWAKSNSGIYIDGDLIQNVNGVWTDMNGTRYWPDGLSLDFYAQKNGDTEFAFNDGAPSFDNFTVEDDVTKQIDLMYSVRKNQAKANDKVQLNFRHALSQVCFRAKNNMKSTQVTITGISVGHLTNTGSFAFPTTDTDKNYVHPSHGDEVDPNAPSLNGGIWTYPANAQYNKQYNVAPLAGSVTLPSESGVINLTCPADDHVNGFEQVLTLLPQTVEAWDPKIPGASKTDWNGAYFLLDLVINNVAEDATGNLVLTPLYTGKAAVPVKIVWNQGYRYIYTFVFDEGGNGGYIPDPTDPKPVLSSIKYEVSVDDFIPVYPDGGNANGGTIMDGDESTYTYKTTLNLHDGTNLTQVKIGSNSTPFSYTLPEKYVPADTEDYTFAGWATTSGATTPTFAKGAPINVDMTKESIDLYAVWVPVSFQGIVNYYINNEKVASTTSNSVTPGQTKNLSRIVDGVTIEQWSLSPDVDELVSSFVWEKSKPEVNVYIRAAGLGFDGNAPQGATVTGTPKSIVKYGKETSYTLTVPNATMSCGNYVFKGWADQAKVETLDDIKYQAGDNITVTTEGKTIYAVWGTPTGVIVAPGAPGGSY